MHGYDISKYGVVKFSENSKLINGLSEKPKEEDVPSNIATIYRCVSTTDIF